MLPPVTFALADANGPGTLAKVNVVSFAGARAALVRPDDLSLAGRLAKKTRLLHARDARARDDTGALLAEADRRDGARDDAGPAPRRLPRRGEPALLRPLLPRGAPSRNAAPSIAERFRAFADEYRASYDRRLASAARARGIDVAGSYLVDRRPAAVRRRDARALARLVIRSRARALVRWTRQLFVYRGWLPYLAGKLRRAT